MLHLWLFLWVNICIFKAGTLTYILWQILQDLAFSLLIDKCVCLCRERFELVAKCFPHCSHLCLDTSGLELIFDLPSLFNMESTVKDLIEQTGGDRDDEDDTDDTDTSEVVGERGGDKEHSLELE